MNCLDEIIRSGREDANARLEKLHKSIFSGRPKNFIIAYCVKFVV